MRPGAAYTALSRARTIESVSIVVEGGPEAAPAVFETAFRTSPAALTCL